MTADTSEQGLESLICAALTGFTRNPAPKGGVQQRPADYGPGWLHGDPAEYDREHCMDLAQLSAFLRETQPEAAAPLGLEQDSPARRQIELLGEYRARLIADVVTGKLDVRAAAQLQEEADEYNDDGPVEELAHAMDG